MRISFDILQASQKGHDIKVAYISGDNLLDRIGEIMPSSKDDALPHLDSKNHHVQQTPETYLFARDPSHPPKTVSANAYLGPRAIVKAFEEGADIIISGRASDASPVIAAAWYWWGWLDTDYDAIAGGLVAGHLIECSAYVTGGNFSGFDRYPIEKFVDPGFPIAEVARDGTCVITKHPNTGGLVTVDTCKSQLLYELQGNVYLNSDVKAYLDDVTVEQTGEDMYVTRPIFMAFIDSQHTQGSMCTASEEALHLRPRSSVFSTRPDMRSRSWPMPLAMLTRRSLNSSQSKCIFSWVKSFSNRWTPSRSKSKSL